MSLTVDDVINAINSCSSSPTSTENSITSIALKYLCCLGVILCVLFKSKAAFLFSVSCIVIEHVRLRRAATLVIIKSSVTVKMIYPMNNEKFTKQLAEHPVIVKIINCYMTATNKKLNQIDIESWHRIHDFIIKLGELNFMVSNPNSKGYSDANSGHDIRWQNFTGTLPNAATLQLLRSVPKLF